MRGKPLATRWRFLAKRSIAAVLYFVLLGGALLVGISVEGWLFAGIGLTVAAVLVWIAVEVIGEGLFELPRLLSYRRYREEWERANDGDAMPREPALPPPASG